MGAFGSLIETVLGGLMAGMLYSLVALGFVLIYKASGVFNFAQGAMVLFAALAMARFTEWIPHWTGIHNLFLVGLGSLRHGRRDHVRHGLADRAAGAAPLVNQEGATLLMATLGIAYFIDGAGPDDLRQRHLQDRHRHAQGSGDGLRQSIVPGRHPGQQGRPDRRCHRRRPGAAAQPVLPEDLDTGRALRAVADDHQAAQSIGIPLNRIWVIVWCVAGVVALVAGMIWGSKLGVQFSLATVALRALPVVILGGLTSVPGAIIGGLIIGVGEKVSEVYLGPFVGGGIEIWFAYVLALLFLLVRPQGLFGEKIIDRV